MLNRLTLTVFIFMLALNAYAIDIITFAVPEFPPYTFEEDDEIMGIGVELVDKVMRDAGILYKMSLVPNHGRAVMETKNGKTDGFFLASRNEERDSIAVFSESLITNKWCWFIPADSQLTNPDDASFKQTARVGTHLNTNTHIWLLENDYNVSGSPPRLDSILKMLKADRVNVIFLAEIVFLHLINKAGDKEESYRKIIETEQPFGIYISKQYIAENPESIHRINAAIRKLRK